MVFLFAFLLAAPPLPLFQAVVTSGWNEKTPTEFTVAENGVFRWRSGTVEHHGKIPRAVVAVLIDHVKAAKPGTIANDAGELHVLWRDRDGKLQRRTFSFPAIAPASTLISEMEEDAAKYSRK